MAKGSKDSGASRGNGSDHGQGQGQGQGMKSRSDSGRKESMSTTEQADRFANEPRQGPGGVRQRGGSSTRSGARSSSPRGRGASNEGSSQGKNISAIDLIRQQHQESRELFDRLLAGNKRGREKIFDQLLVALATHFEAEEKVFYPAMKKRDTQELLFESAEEHLSAKRLLADLVDCDPGDETYKAKVEVLRRQIEEHIAVEEQRVLPIAEQMFDDDYLVGLAQEMTAKAVEMTSSGDEAVREHLVDDTEHAPSI